MSTAELYRFTQSDQVWTWTSADAPVEHLGETYTPIPIGRGDAEQASDSNKANLTIKVPRDNPLAQQHLAYTFDIVTSLTVFKPDPFDPDAYVTFWKGRVTGAKATGAEVSIGCESIMTSMRRTGLRARFTRNCRHAVYGRGCNLDPEAFAVPGFATAIAGLVVTVPNAALRPDGKYVGGMLRFGVYLRLITAHVGDQVTLSRPIPPLAGAIANSGYGMNYGNHYGGVGVKIYPGCDRSESTCDAEFNNLDNNGSFLRIPIINPMGGSSIV